MPTVVFPIGASVVSEVVSDVVSEADSDVVSDSDPEAVVSSGSRFQSLFVSCVEPPLERSYDPNESSVSLTVEIVFFSTLSLFFT